LKSLHIPFLEYVTRFVGVQDYYDQAFLSILETIEFFAAYAGVIIAVHTKTVQGIGKRTRNRAKGKSPFKVIALEKNGLCYIQWIIRGKK
jgi:hypothetical protein